MRPPIEEMRKTWEAADRDSFRPEIALCDYALALEKEKAELEDKLKWACRKLAAIRANFGNAPFTTNDLDLIISVIGSEEFIKYSEPSKKGKGVWS